MSTDSSTRAQRLHRIGAVALGIASLSACTASQPPSPAAEPAAAPRIADTAAAPADAGLHTRPGRIRVARIDASFGAPLPFRIDGGDPQVQLGDLRVRAHVDGVSFGVADEDVVVLGHARVRRGRAAPTEVARGILDERGVLIGRVDADAHERLAAYEGGIEQSWSFPTVPPGDGDLVVDVPVDDGQPHAPDAAGVAIGSGDRSVRYGHATFLDSAGLRAPVPVQLVGRTLHMVVPEAVLDASQCPCVLDPRITRGTLTVNGAATGPAWGNQHWPASGRMANDNALVTYLDEADGSSRLFGQRFGASGAVGTRFAIAAPVDSFPPAMACSATQCLVVYLAAGTLVGQRLSATGTLSGASFPIAAVGTPVFATVAENGTDFTVAWATSTAPPVVDVFARYVQANGTLVGMGATACGNAIGTESVTAATTGNTTVVAWDEILSGGSRIVGVRLDASASLLDPAPIPLADRTNLLERGPALLPAGANAMHLVYMTSTGTFQPGMFATSVSLAGGLSGSGSTYLDANCGIDNAQARLATDGTVIAVHCFSPTAGLAATAALPVPYRENFGGTWVGATTFHGGSVVVLNGTPTMVTGRLEERMTLPPGETVGFDLTLSAEGSSTEVILTTGAPSAHAPRLSAVSGQMGVSHLVAGAYPGERAAMQRYDGTLAPVGGPVTLITTTIPGAAGTEYLESPSAAGMVGVHALGACKSFRNSSSGTFEFITLGTSTVATPGVRFSTDACDSVRHPAVLAGSTTGYVLGTYRDWIYPYTATGLGAPVSQSSWNVEEGSGGDSAGASWSYYTAFLHVDGVRTSISSTFGAYPFGLRAARGATTVGVVHRVTGGLSATLTLRPPSAPATISSTLTLGADTTPLFNPTITFDGTNYQVAYVRGATVYLQRVTETGVLLDTAPAAVATDAVVGSALELTSGRDGKVLVAYETFDASPTVRAQGISLAWIDWTDTSSGAPLGSPCTSAFACGSGYCIDGVCCDTLCGLGAPNDCMACAVSANGLVDGTCGPATSAVTCRAANGVCDVADTCDGVSTSCPTDGYAAAGTACGTPSTQACRADPVCNGVSPTCPAGLPRPAGTLCRASNGVCDVAETCDGTAVTCPTDRFATGLVCRAATDVCDATESCSGTSANCPADGVIAASAGVVCRASATNCDRAEQCDGSGTACPADAPARAVDAVVCRPAAGPCDVADVCDGTGFTCPTDTMAPASTLCRVAAGPCDVDEVCDGVAAQCPTDGVVAAGTVCRDTVGDCDSAERCDGASPRCPSDRFVSFGTVCRGNQGPCDQEERCSGFSASCPTDRFDAGGTVCRPATSVCDSAEACSGLGPSCASDRKLLDGVRCDDGLVCNGDETCQAGTCTSGEALVCGERTVCDEAAGQCVRTSRAVGSCAASASAPRAPGGCSAVVAISVLWMLSRRRRRAVAPRRPARLPTARTTRRGAVVALLLAVSPYVTGCLCPIGAASCDGRCVDVAYDEQNCGACGHVCTDGACVDGECLTGPVGGTPCDADTTCDDGNVCTGVERCIAGHCRDGVPLACDDGLTCTTDVCSPTMGVCIATPTTATCGLTP